VSVSVVVRPTSVVVVVGNVNVPVLTIVEITGLVSVLLVSVSVVVRPTSVVVVDGSVITAEFTYNELRFNIRFPPTVELPFMTTFPVNVFNEPVKVLFNGSISAPEPPDTAVQIGRLLP